MSFPDAHPGLMVNKKKRRQQQLEQLEHLEPLEQQEQQEQQGQPDMPESIPETSAGGEIIPRPPEQSLQHYASSKPFKFIVGSDKRDFFLHADLVAKQSPKLQTLIYGGMKESEDQCVNWEHEDVETFLRFTEYLYSGSYKTEESQPRLVPSAFVKPEGVSWEDYDMEEDLVKEILDDTAPASHAYQTSLDPNMSRHLWPRFKTLYKVPPGYEQPAARSRDEKQYDHTNVFLNHAMLYVFADYHGIDALQTLTLWRLHKLLVDFELTEDGLHDITDLTRYCFQKTMAGDRLSDMVGLYAACYLKSLWKLTEFRDLVDMTHFAHGLITLALAMD